MSSVDLIHIRAKDITCFLNRGLVLSDVLFAYISSFVVDFVILFFVVVLSLLALAC